jgi:hypothetical protein
MANKIKRPKMTGPGHKGRSGEREGAKRTRVASPDMAIDRHETRVRRSRRRMKGDDGGRVEGEGRVQ